MTAIMDLSFPGQRTATATSCIPHDSVYVVVQFYPWFTFSFLLFQTHYHVIIIHYHTQKQKKRKFEPRIKLNHNIYMPGPRAGKSENGFCRCDT